jgi:hypothetical protein
MKNLLLYYGIGSSRKMKKFKYMTQLGDNLMEKVYECETIEMRTKRMKKEP